MIASTIHCEPCFLSPSCVKKKKIVQKFRRNKISICKGTDAMGWIIKTCPLLEEDTKANPEPGLPRTLTSAKAARAVPYRRVISLESQGRGGRLLDSWRLYWLKARGYADQSGPIKRAQLEVQQGSVLKDLEYPQHPVWFWPSWLLSLTLGFIHKMNQWIDVPQEFVL